MSEASAALDRVADEVVQVSESNGRPQPLPLRERAGALGGLGEREQRDCDAAVKEGHQAGGVKGWS